MKWGEKITFGMLIVSMLFFDGCVREKSMDAGKGANKI